MSRSSRRRLRSSRVRSGSRLAIGRGGRRRGGRRLSSGVRWRTRGGVSVRTRCWGRCQRCRRAFEDVSDGLAGEPLSGVAVPVDRSEQRPVRFGGVVVFECLIVGERDSDEGVTGQVCVWAPWGSATAAPSAFWSVLDRRSYSSAPRSLTVMSEVLRATSSERRSAPAQPTRISARSRVAAGPVQCRSMARRSATVSAWALRVRSPASARSVAAVRMTARASSVDGGSVSATAWALRIAATARAWLTGPGRRRPDGCSSRQVFRRLRVGECGRVRRTR